MPDMTKLLEEAIEIVRAFLIELFPSTNQHNQLPSTAQHSRAPRRLCPNP
jgi:hypothetical protein